MGSTDRSIRQAAILKALERAPHQTDYFSMCGRCSLGEATVELMRLEREGLAERGTHLGGMTWRGK